MGYAGEIADAQGSPGLGFTGPAGHRGGWSKNLETVDDMINELVAKNRPDLLGLGQICAGLIFTDETSKQWLKERFNKVLDILQDSWVYQETLQKGIEQGIEKGREQGLEEGLEKGLSQGRLQGLQQAAISIVATRFPGLERLARLVITTISDLKRLEVLIIELSVATSREDVKQLLLSLIEEPPHIDSI